MRRDREGTGPAAKSKFLRRALSIARPFKRRSASGTAEEIRQCGRDSANPWPAGINLAVVLMQKRNMRQNAVCCGTTRVVVQSHLR